jgi:hypothetical protein
MGLAIMGAGIGLGLGYLVGFIFLLLFGVYAVVWTAYTIAYIFITGVNPNKPPTP